MFVKKEVFTGSGVLPIGTQNVWLFQGAGDGGKDFLLTREGHPTIGAEDMDNDVKIAESKISSVPKKDLLLER